MRAAAAGFDWAVAAGVALITFAVHARSLGGGFVNWDDPINLTNNPHYRGFGISHLKWMFSLTADPHYIPVTWLSFAADFALWGMDPRGYHLTNVLLHALCAAVFYAAASRLLRAASPDGGDREKDFRLAAAFGALFFSLHPLRVESVAWVTERRDVLSGLFLLLTLLFYLKAAKPSGSRQGPWFAASLAAYAASLLSKSIGITLPAVLLILDVYPLRRASRRSRLEKIPYALLAAAAAALALQGQRHFAGQSGLAHQPPGARLAQAFFGAVFYVGKTLWPSGLSPFYPFPPGFDPWGPRTAALALGAAALTIAAFLARRRRPGCLAAWLCYGVTLAPVSGVLQFGRQIAADRYTFVPCQAFAVLAAAALLAALRRARGKYRAPLVLACAAWLAALGTLSWRQTGFWRDSLSLWSRVLETAPDSAFAHSQLGFVLAEKDPRSASAEEHFREAIRLDPSFPDPYHGLGNILNNTGRKEEAIDHYVRFLDRDRSNAEVYVNLGLALADVGQLAAGIEAARAAVRLKPGLPRAHDHLAVLLAKSGRFDEAVSEHKTALRLDPTYVTAAINLGDTLSGMGKLDVAIASYREAVRLDPASAGARNNLGVALARKGDFEGAESEFQRALGLKPDFKQALENLALLRRRRPTPER